MSKFARFLRIISIALIAWGAIFIPQKTFADEQEDCEMMAPDYYWDGATCISYQEECESNPGYYWDGATCMSEEDQCSMQGPDYYWDGATCISYQEECESSPGYYWDGATCMSEEDQCSMQGADYYWDGESCVYCDTMMGGYYWDSENNTCESTCDEANGEYWDGSQCAIDDVDCETEYGNDYYWNGSECEYCDTRDGYYWDDENLTCVADDPGDECGAGETDDGEGNCVCDESSDYYGDAGSCEYCDVSSGDYEWQNGECVSTSVCGDDIKYNNQCYDSKFQLTTTNDTTSFSFQMSAAGEFYIDCGVDGNFNSTGNHVGYLNRNNTTATTYTCSYQNAGAHVIKFGGAATGYTTDATTAAIRFNITGSNDPNAQKIASISGSLGAIFGTVANPTVGQSQPRFYYTFAYASNMTGSIPANLFSGISGAPASYMFYHTFAGCSGLTGSIPATLFSGISGAPAHTIFASTFEGCSGLTGSIPPTLFSGISGAPADYMFTSTFSGCSGLTGSIPATLFSGISGAPAPGMFRGTFYGCRGLTGSIPSGLFGNLSGTPASYMFNSTFSGCSGLTGSIPSGLFGNLSGTPAQSMFAGTFYGCSGLTGSIPSGLFGNLSGAPAQSMFNSTFNGCSGLTGSIPSGLFGNLSGAPAQYMFISTFHNCSGLTGFSDGINTKTFIPGTFLSGINTDTSVLDQAPYMFDGTGLASTCPANTYNVTREQFNTAGKPWCAECPSGTHYTGTGATSVNQCCQTGYDWDGTTCALTCGTGEIDDGEGNCVCDESSDYYGDVGSCEYCDPTTSTWDGTTCVSLLDENGCTPDEEWDEEYGCHEICVFGSYDGELGYCTDEHGCTADEYFNGRQCMPHDVNGCTAYEEYDDEAGECVSVCNYGEEWTGTECVSVCDESNGETWDGTACVCDAGSDYYGDTGSCEYCDTSNGYYWDSENNSCESTCDEANGETWDGTTCVSVCSDGEEWDGALGTCVSVCSDGETWDGTTCVSVCSDGEEWDGTQCVSICSDGEEWDGTTCVSVCDETNGEWWDGTACVSVCSDGEEWDGTTCVSVCGADAYWNGNECECTDPDTYYDENTNSCVFSCPNGNYTRDQNGYCIEETTNCPAYSTYTRNGGGWLSYNGATIIEKGGMGADFDGDGVIENGECLNLIVVANDISNPLSYSDGNISAAYCLYNTSTGNYDLACTERAEICDDTEVETISSDTTLGLINTFAGYMGWTASDLANPASLFAYTTSNSPLYPRCSVSSVVDLTWVVDGETYDTSTCTIDEDIVLPEQPTRPGYTFAGWVLQQDVPLE